MTRITKCYNFLTESIRSKNEEDDRNDQPNKIDEETSLPGEKQLNYLAG
jgi:hypothetical protein